MRYNYHDYPALRISPTAPSGIPSFGNPHQDSGFGGGLSKKKI